MEYKVLYRKYRPTNFNELVGQNNVKDVLINSIKTNKLAHAYIFTGPRGTGKTSTAKIFAKTLNCLNNSNGISCEECESCKNFKESPDIIEIDAASNNGVEEIRTLRENVKIYPYNSKYKVYIIDEVHMLSNSAWNALLKTLEEPPKHVIFILATTEVNKIPITVMSRCQRFDFFKIPTSEMLERLKYIIKAEKIEIDDEALQAIVRLSNGCLRDALSDLDQVSKIGGKITLSNIENVFGIVSKKELDTLFTGLQAGNKKIISEVIDAIEEKGITVLTFINEFINYLIDKVINDNLTYENTNNIKILIEKINKLIIYFNPIVNPYSLLKIELISYNYFPGNNLEDKPEEKTEQNLSSLDSTIIKKTDESEVKNEYSENIHKMSSNVKLARINNSFYNASKIKKKNFTENWNKFIKYLELHNNYSILGMLNNIEIQVVSDMNAIFSFKNESDSLIFNNQVSFVEVEYKRATDEEMSFISLVESEWLEKKQEYIANKEKYNNYIDEKKIEIDENDNNIENLAEEIFGNDIIEIR